MCCALLLSHKSKHRVTLKNPTQHHNTTTLTQHNNTNTPTNKMSSSNTNSHSKPQPQACLFLYIAVFDCLRCYTIVDVFSSVFPFIQEANMALQTHSPSHSHNNINNNKGVFGDVYTIIKDMHADHHNATFDFRLPPLPVTCPPLFPSPLIVPTFCLFFFQFFYFPFSEFSGLSRGPRVFQRCPCRGNDKGYTCSS